MNAFAIRAVLLATLIGAIGTRVNAQGYSSDGFGGAPDLGTRGNYGFGNTREFDQNGQYQFGVQGFDEIDQGGFSQSDWGVLLNTSVTDVQRGQFFGQTDSLDLDDIMTELGHVPDLERQKIADLVDAIRRGMSGTELVQKFGWGRIEVQGTPKPLTKSRFRQPA